MILGWRTVRLGVAALEMCRKPNLRLWPGVRSPFSGLLEGFLIAERDNSRTFQGYFEAGQSPIKTEENLRHSRKARWSRVRKVHLGETGLEVSEFCLGTLPMGPLQKNLSPEEGGRIVRKAVAAGINFIDTAEAYRTYPHIRAGLVGVEEDVIIASKSAASTYADMQASVEAALEALKRDSIDIFHLHAARAGVEVFEERAGALQCLQDLKSRGLVKAVGISTHRVAVVEAAARRGDIDVIYPLINLTGMGIIDGSAAEMAAAIARAHAAGKGIYAMKVYAGGNLIDRAGEALNYVRRLAGIDAISIGVVSEVELEANLQLWAGQGPDSWPKSDKKLIILDFCKACGCCVEACPNEALFIRDGKAHVDRERCILCGYCSSHCPQFAIRMV